MLGSPAVALAQSDVDVEEVFDGVSTGDWVLAVVVLVAGIVLSRLAQRIITRLVARDSDEDLGAQVAGRVVGYLFILGGLVYALTILDVRIGPVLGALGLGGLAIAFAAQSILENLFASVLLQSRRPFRRGDQIGTNDLDGTVEDVNFRTVVLRTYDGERVLVPCSQVLNNPIVNYTARRLRRSVLTVGVSYATDLRSAQDLLRRTVAQVDGVAERPGSEAWVERFGESSIDFAVRFWHASDIATEWRVRSEVAMSIKEAFDGAGIEIPFPQRTLSFLPDAGHVDVRAAVRDGSTVDRP